jgi:hypothetical protein
LLLKHSKRRESAVSVEHSLDTIRSEPADELALEIRNADVDLFEDPSEEVGLVLVAETAHVCARRKIADESPDGVSTADRNDLDSLGGEIAPLAAREQFEHSAVADPFDGDDLLCIHD